MAPESRALGAARSRSDDLLLGGISWVGFAGSVEVDVDGSSRDGDRPCPSESVPFSEAPEGREKPSTNKIENAQKFNALTGSECTIHG